MLFTSISDIASMENTISVEPSFLHVINPFTTAIGSEHEIAQSTTFSCIVNAKEAAKNIDIHILCVVYPEDQNIVPDEFICIPSLTRSVSDVNTFNSHKKLPLLFDILNAVKTDFRAAENQYIIYSNIDIAPMPFFYEMLRELTLKGFDAIVINRRTVSKFWGKDSASTLMYSDVGKTHPGTDCFIFRRKILDDFVESETCLGAIGVMKSLLYNLAALSECMVIITDAHATFHIGDDRVWTDQEFNEYATHNHNEAIKVAKNIIKISPVYRKRLQDFVLERNEIFLFDLLDLKRPKGIIVYVKTIMYLLYKYTIKKPSSIISSIRSKK